MFSIRKKSLIFYDQLNQYFNCLSVFHMVPDIEVERNKNENEIKAQKWRRLVCC